jgi:hypothetical protein
MARPSLHQQLVSFKCSIRSIVKRAINGNTCANLFKPFITHERQLKGLAIEGVHASLSFNVCITCETQQHIAALLVKLSRKCNANVVREFIDSNVELKPTKLVLKGKAGWDDALSRHKGIDVQGSSCTQEADITSPCETYKILISFLICPICKRDNVAKDAQLQQADLDIKIKCSYCCKGPPARDWKCNCGVVWHTCKRHAPKAAKLKANGKLNTFVNKASKRLLYDASLGQLLDDDLRRESQMAKCQANDDLITLVDSAYVQNALRPNMIPLKLRERFPDAVGVT